MERITSLMTSQATISDLAASYQQLASTDQEMSSGLSISQPSDNPYGASRVVDLNNQLSQLTSYTGDVNDGTAWLNTAGNALSDINNSLQTVREIVVEASNGTMSQSELSSAATEVNQLIGSIKDSANATYDGNYVFSGSATQTPPYQSGSNDTYQGNSGTITRSIGPNTDVQVNTNINQLLGGGTAAADGGLLDTLRTIASDLQGGTSANVSALSSTDLNDLDSNMSTLQNLQANVGALTDRMSLAASRIQDSQQTATTLLANTQDADLTTLATQYSSDQAAYTAALKAGASIVQNSLVNFMS